MNPLERSTYNREEILREVLNNQARIRGFFNWNEMCKIIPRKQKELIEACVREALSKINWQGVLE